ncbi:hypothetical protein EFW17_06550 [Halostreptopolyspora alba]|uniref:Uncharacterized protein n=1 Tax=Halostreptopolyspora alba TaxID=2487137 RepID=A0A3N0EEA7_9ACTN|nr:hypothetical protein EFW17_06550 [Nocardiopsaceae bacterium YIM 96095]
MVQRRRTGGSRLGDVGAHSHRFGPLVERRRAVSLVCSRASAPSSAASAAATSGEPQLPTTRSGVAWPASRRSG